MRHSIGSKYLTLVPMFFLMAVCLPSAGATELQPIGDPEDLDSITLIGVVGRKIQIEEVPNVPPPGYVSFDQKFVAEYEVLSVLHGTHDGNTIRFTIYDHYGVPPLSYSDTALFYVTEHDGELVQSEILVPPCL